MRRRRLATVARVARAVIAALALLVGGGVLFLRTPWGGELLRSVALRQLDGAIAGRIAVERLRFTTNRLRLGGVELRDPEGELVARVNAIDVSFSPLALLRRRIDLSRVWIERPELRLRVDRRGLNLTRALASRRGSAAPAPEPAGQGSSVRIDVGALEIAGGVIDYRAAGPAAEPRHARIENLDIAVRASLHLDGSSADGVADGRARVVAPVDAPLSFHLDARLDAPGAPDARLRVALGDAALEATARIASGGGVAAHVERLRAVPQLLNALFPGLRVQAPIELTGELSRAGATADVHAELDVRAAGAHLHAQGAVDVAGRRVRSVVVEGRDVDLGAVVARLPRSHLGFTLHADGGGPDLDRLDGSLSLAMPAGRLDGAAVGPLAVTVRASGGRLAVRPFALELPGLTIAGSGTFGRHGLDANVQIRARDLALTARSLASAEGGARLPIAGRGDVALHVGGSPETPAIDARARFAALAVAGHSARDLSVAVRGEWTRARSAAVIDSFSLAIGSARWTQAGPVRLGFGAGRTRVEGLDLRAGDQQVRADVDVREERVSARIAIDRLDLAALPRPLLPASTPALEGALGLHADLSGTRRRPELTARVDLTRGRVGRYRGLTLAIDGRYAAERAQATIAASGIGASVRGTLDLPLRWPLPERREPLAAELRVDVPDLAQVLAVAEAAGAPGSTPPIAGRFAATLHVAGTASDPSVVVHAETGGLRVRNQAIGEVTVDASARSDAPMRATIRFGGGPAAAVGAGELASGTLSVETPLSLRTLAQAEGQGHRAPRRDWLATPVAVRADLQKISLEKLAVLAHRPRAIAGTATVRLELRGPVRAPAGALNLVVLGAHGPRFPETDVRVDAVLGARDVRLAAQVVRKQRLLGWASGIAEIPAARLGDRAALVSAPIHVRAGAGPVDLRQTSLDGVATAGDGSPAAKTSGDGGLHAQARVEVAIDGNLSRPTMRANAQLRALRNGSVEAGAIQALLTYADRRAELDVQLTSARGGARVHGAATVDLGYPALARAGDLERAPIDVTIDADGLDLTWMSGLVSPIRRLGGQLTVAARAHGTLGSLSSRSSSPPVAISGRLEWTDGELALVGFGSYKGIHLVAHGDDHAVVLDGLDVRSREGRAHFEGALDRTSGGQQLQLTAKVNRFPIYAQGELLALVSLDASALAAVAHGNADGKLKIDELRAEVAERPKNLQSLARPDDVVLVSDGEPIDRSEAVKLGRLRAGRQKAGSPSEGGGPPPAPETKQPPFTAHITVDASRNLWLRSDDADIEVGLERGFRIEARDSVRVLGEVSLERGHVDLMGRRLELQSGSTARFVGPPAVPIIDVSAKFVDDRDNLTVLLRAHGPIDKLEINVSAPDHPGLTETQLYTVLVVGHLQSGGDSGGGAATAVSSSALSTEAGSLVAGVLASQLQKVLSKRLPLDVLSIQTGQGLAGSRLEAGKYVGRDVYVGYVGRSGANPALLQNRNAVRVEYQLSHRWSFDAEYGDAGTGTADLMWTKRY